MHRIDNNRLTKKLLYSQLWGGWGGGGSRLRFKDVVKRNMK